jgi:hypothetical protein
MGKSDGMQKMGKDKVIRKIANANPDFINMCVQYLLRVTQAVRG